jgi:type VI secretion system protein VasJ
MPSFDETPILALGTTPISDAARTGRDVADDEGFLLIEAESAKLDRIDLGTPDWFQLENAALNILKTKSKDVQIACALGLALFKKHRYAGVAAALALYTELVKNFWEGLFPERPKRRKARIEAYCELLVERGWFRDVPPTPDDFDAIDQCLTRVADLAAALTAVMADDPPDFNKFIRAVKELAGRRPKPTEAPSAAPAAGAASGATGDAAAFAGTEVQDVSGAVSAILTAATFIRKAEPKDPVPYAAVRLIKWAKIQLPTSDAAMHQIDPPDKALVEALTHQFGKQLWDNLLKNAEGAFRGNDPLWLDIQRYVCSAMQGLGTDYDRARQMVMDLTGGLVRRLGKGVFELTFRGGMPLCSGETRMWLEAEVVQPQGGGTGGGGAGASNGKLTEATDAARKLAAGGKLNEAIKALQDGLVTCTQRRDRLLWRLRIAELCFNTQRLQLAAPLLEECYDEIRRHHIDDWEPSLAVEVAQTLYRCRKALATGEKQPTPEALAGVRESFAWLCQLDPLAALAAEPSGK